MTKLNLPKEYLSYSQVRTWLENKDRYRSRYFEGLPDHKSPELMFGSEVAKGLEDGTLKVPGLEVYPVPEWRFFGEIAGVPFSAYIDQYWPEKFKFRESKTGKVAWTQKKVDEHMQLDVYSLVIQTSEGQVDDECHLDWIVTRNKVKCLEFDGHQLCTPSREIEATGELISFRRIVTQIQRDRMREIIKSVAGEISQDYTRWQALNPEKYAQKHSVG